MERRDFLLTTAGALASVSTVAGCGGASIPRMHASEADELLRRLDVGLASVRNGPSTFRPDRRNQNADRFARLGLEALVVADVARSIPQGTAIPEHLASRLRDELGVLDRCTAAYTSLLSGLTPAGRRNVERAVRGTPDAGMQIAEWIDERAAENAISHESRLRLRRVASDLTTRVRRQSMSAVIDDAVGKVERVMVQKGGSLAQARQATSSAMLASIWQAVDETGDGLGQPGYGEPGVEVAPQPVEPAPQGGRGDVELIVGGVMMGTGVLVFGVTTLVEFALAGSVGLGMLISATVGGTLVLAGLIVLIIGLVQNA